MGNPVVEIFELIEYVNGGSRPFQEGCRILNSNHILLCGLCNSSKKGTDKYFALCLKSTSVSDYPHEINITIDHSVNKKIINAHCSCKAGNSGSCKHIVGVLLFLNRRSKNEIEELGCTDLRQQWGRIKEKVNDAYAAEPFEKFCHGSQMNVNYDKNPEVRRQIFKNLCEANSESELAQHTKCYRSSEVRDVQSNSKGLSIRILKNLNDNSSNKKKPSIICNLNNIYGFTKNIDETSDEFKVLEGFLKNNIWSILKNFQITITSIHHVKYYNNNVCVSYEQAKEILLSTVKQNSPLWYKERCKRITGSVCYNIFTFMKKPHTEEEWTKKFLGIYAPSFKGNTHTLRGQELESAAKIAYTRQTNHRVQDIGFLILSTSPWLGFSADGIAKKDILIEIKCPKNENNLSAESLVHTLSYVQIREEKLILKRHHIYYGQVQLGMALLGLQTCHFVIYESINDSCAIVEVPRDDEFICDLLCTLSTCYFTYLLPWLTERDKEESTSKNI